MENLKGRVVCGYESTIDELLGTVHYIEVDGVRYRHGTHWYMGDIFVEIFKYDNPSNDSYMYIPVKEDTKIDMVYKINYNKVNMIVVRFNKTPRYYAEFNGMDLLNEALQKAYDTIGSEMYYLTMPDFSPKQYITWWVSGYKILGDPINNLCENSPPNYIVPHAVSRLINNGEGVTYESINKEIYKTIRDILRNPRNRVNLPIYYKGRETIWEE